MRSKIDKNGFTLLEVLAVVIIIGILAMLGWSNMNELIQTNKAKEASRTLVTFAERAVAEGKMRKDSVFITVNANTVEARFNTRGKNPADMSQILANGFNVANAASAPATGCPNKNLVIKSEIRIGTSGIVEQGCLAVCSVNGNYCGSATKTTAKNTFTAQIKRKNSTAWEAL